MRIYVLIVCCLCLGSCHYKIPDSNLQSVLNQGVLRVGTLYGSTTYYNGATEPEGFEYEMAKGFADYLGVRLEVYPYYNAQELFVPLQEGNINLIAANIPMSPGNREKLKFGPAYQSVSQKLVFRQGKKRPRSFSDLMGKLVVTADSSLNHVQQEILSAVNQDDEKPWQWEATEDLDIQEILESVLTGQIDYTIVDSNMLALMRRRHPELSVGFTVHKELPVAWAVPKPGESEFQDDSILAALIEYFGIIKNNGTFASLEDKYFGHVRQFNYVDTTLFLKAAKQTLPEYQHWFQQYSTEVDWRLMAATSYQESHWNPRAKSPTGVRGMMMLTLPTARDWGVKSRLDPEQSIRGGINYYSSLLRRIPDRIQYPDRLWFALAAYNIGLGHLEDARIITQRQGANPDLWVDVKKHLPLLRQKRHYKRTKYGYARGNEAVTYVANIRRYYDSLVYLFDDESEFPDFEQTSDGTMPEQDKTTD